MKLSYEQIEDIVTVGEAKSAKEDKSFKVYLLYTKPIEEIIEEELPVRGLGFFIQFRPKKMMVSRGISNFLADESEIHDYWETQNEEGVWKKGDLEMGWTDLRSRKDFIDKEYVLKINGQTYASWKPFAKAFGLTELVSVGTKIPKPLAIKLQKITAEEGETPSWRIRMLVQEYLTEQITDRVRRVMFSE